MSAETAAAARQDRPMRADARRNYDRLLKAAFETFGEQGADTAALEEIARCAGVGIGTLYRHFPTRQALLEAVYRDQVEALRARSAGLLQAEPSGEALADWLRALVAFGATKRSLTTALLQAEPPGEALADWLRALVAFGATKRSLTTALLQTIGKESELLSSSGAVMREATSRLLERAQQAGAARTDVTGTDVLRLAHGVSMVADWAAGDQEQADRMLMLVIDGLLTGRRPGRG